MNKNKKQKVLNEVGAIPSFSFDEIPFFKDKKKELRVLPNDTGKRVMFAIKQFLLENEYIDVISCDLGSPASIRASESLVRLGYVTYVKVKTDTTLLNGRRYTRLLVRLKKTDNFKALYDENEEIRKKTAEIDSTI